MTDVASNTLERLMRESEWLRALAVRLVDDPTEADDVVQRTRMAALARPPTGAGSFRGWLARVATNVVRQDRRASGRRARRERAAARGEAAPSPAELVERVELQRTVARAVVSLDEPYRTTLLLRFYEDLPPRDIAARMDVPARAVETRVRRGLDRLRRELDRRHGTRERWLPSVALLAAGRGAASGTPSPGLSAGTKLAAGAAAAALVAVVVVRVLVSTERDLPAPALEKKPAAREPAGPEDDDAGPARERAAGPSVPAAAPDTAPPPAPATGLRGRVLDPDGRPAQDVTVHAAPIARLGAPGATDRTDARGRYRITGLTAGTVRLRAGTADGVCGERTGVGVVEGRVVDVPDLPLHAGGVIRGAVRTGDGVPVAAARVTAGEPAIERAVSTGPHGRFEVGSRLPGRYPVTVDAPGHALARDVVVELASGDVVDLDLVLVPARPITGRVSDPAGRSIGGATVEAGRWGSLRSAADGTFRIDVASDEPVTLLAAKAGYRPLRREGVRPGIAPLSLTLAPAGEIRGVAVDAQTGAPVRLEAVEVQWEMPAPFGSPGRFDRIFEGPDEVARDDGTFTIRLEEGTGRFRIEARADGYAPSRSAPFARAPGATTDGVVVRMQPGRRLEVAVVDALRGAAVPGAEVVVHEVDEDGDGRPRGLRGGGAYRTMAKPARSGPTNGLGRPLARETCDARGAAWFESLPAGPLAVVVEAAGSAPARVDGVRPSPAADERARVEVGLTAGGAVAGRVLDDRGAPAPARVVVARSADGARGEGVSGEDGWYRIEHLAPGRYVVSVAPPPVYRDPAMDVFLPDEGVGSSDAEGTRRAVDVVEGATATLDVVAAPAEDR